MITLYLFVASILAIGVSSTEVLEETTETKKPDSSEFDQYGSLFDSMEDETDFRKFQRDELNGPNLHRLLREKHNRDRRFLDLENLHPHLSLHDENSPDNLFEPELYNELAGAYGLESDPKNGDHQLPMDGRLPRHYYPELDGFPPEAHGDFGVGDDAMLPMRRLHSDASMKEKEDDVDDDLGSYEEKQPSLDDMIAQGMDLDGLYRKMMQSLSQFQQQQRLRHL